MRRKIRKAKNINNITYIITPDIHLGHPIGAWNLQLDDVLVLADVHVRGHLAPLKVDIHHAVDVVHHVLAALVHVQMQVAAREPVLLVRLQRETLRPANIKIQTTSTFPMFTNLLQKPQLILQLGHGSDVVRVRTDAGSFQGVL